MTDDAAGDYGSNGKRLTCILYEGAITVASTGVIFAAGTNYMPTYSPAAAISKGDYVGLFVDTGNTYDACQGIPCVTTAAAGAPIIGRVVTEPRWARAPAATTSTWATDLANQNYRTAVVEFFCVLAAHKALTSGDSTAITVGAPLLWDESDAWTDAGTTYTGAFSFHYHANTAAGYILVGFGMYAAGSADTDCAGIDTTT